MGFNLEQMIADIEKTIELEINPNGPLLDIKLRLAWWKQYAEECGQLMQSIRFDVGCEVARQELLRIGGFTCTYDTEINTETLGHIGTCNGCPIIDAEGRHNLAVETICRRERWFVTMTPNGGIQGSARSDDPAGM